VSMGGFPWKLGVEALALLGEGMSKGALQAIMAGIADGTLAIYVERSISTDTIIAGDEDIKYGKSVRRPIRGDDDDDDDDDDGGEV